MKTYKELQKKIEPIIEGQETVGGAARSAHSDFGVHRVEHPEQLGRLNDVYQEDGGLYQMDAKIIPSTPASEDNL